MNGTSDSFSSSAYEHEQWLRAAVDAYETPLRRYAERIVGEYPTELEPLARELNALVAHNQDVVERQRTHVGNLAHALKTPLSVMLTALPCITIVSTSGD